MFTFAKFCRLCCQNDNFLVYYTDTDLENISSYNKLKKLMPALVSNDSQYFPPWICVLCREELDQFHVFYEKCFYNYELLKRYVEQLSLYNSKTVSPTIKKSTETLHSESNESSHLEYSLSVHDTQSLKQGLKDWSVFDDDTVELTKDSSDSNISITKNEILDSEEDNLDFKFFYNTVLQSESNSSSSNKTDTNDKNTNETFENKKQTRVHESGFLNNNIETQNNEAILAKDESFEISEDILELREKEESQNNETCLDKTVRSKNSPPEILKNLLEKKDKCSTDYLSGLEGLNNKIDERNTNEANLKVPIIQNIWSAEPIDNSEKSHNSPAQVTEELYNKETDENSDESNCSNSLRLNLRTRSRSSVYYHDVSDNEDFSLEDDDSDYQPEDDFVDTDIFSLPKKRRYTCDNTNKSRLGNAVTSSTSDNTNIRNLNQTNNYVNTTENAEKSTTSNVSNLVFFKTTKPTNVVSPLISNASNNDYSNSGNNLKATLNETNFVLNKSISSSFVSNEASFVSNVPSFVSNEASIFSNEASTFPSGACFVASNLAPSFVLNGASSVTTNITPPFVSNVPSFVINEAPPVTTNLASSFVSNVFSGVSNVPSGVSNVPSFASNEATNLVSNEATPIVSNVASPLVSNTVFVTCENSVNEILFEKETEESPAMDCENNQINQPNRISSNSNIIGLKNNDTFYFQTVNKTANFFPLQTNKITLVDIEKFKQTDTQTNNTKDSSLFTNNVTSTQTNNLAYNLLESSPTYSDVASPLDLSVNIANPKNTDNQNQVSYEKDPDNFLHREIITACRNNLLNKLKLADKNNSEIIDLENYSIPAHHNSRENLNTEIISTFRNKLQNKLNATNESEQNKEISPANSKFVDLENDLIPAYRIPREPGEVNLDLLPQNNKNVARNNAKTKLNTSAQTDQVTRKKYKKCLISAYNKKLQTKFNSTNKSKKSKRISPAISNIIDQIPPDKRNKTYIISKVMYKNNSQTESVDLKENKQMSTSVLPKLYTILSKLIQTEDKAAQSYILDSQGKLIPNHNQILPSTANSNIIDVNDLSQKDKQTLNENNKENTLNSEIINPIENKLQTTSKDENQTQVSPALLSNMSSNSLFVNSEIIDLDSPEESQNINSSNSNLINHENTQKNSIIFSLLSKAKKTNADKNQLDAISLNSNKSQLDANTISSNKNQLDANTLPSNSNIVDLDLNKITSISIRKPDAPIILSDDETDDYFLEKNFCKHCNKNHKTAKDLELHMEMHKHEKDYFCVFCHFQLINRKLLMTHYRRNHLDKRSCPLCEQTFETHTILTTHLYSHYDIDVLNCPKCDKIFLYAKQLYFHLQDTHKVTSFDCFRCGKSHSSPSNAYKHMLRVHGSFGMYLCHICGKKYFSNAKLNFHLKSKHKYCEKSICSYCGKQYTSLYSLRMHVLSNHESGTYTCDICSKEFATTYRLNLHKKTHYEKFKRFECKVCKKKFLHKVMLVNHERVHTGDKPFKCKICGKAFSQEVSVGVHMRVHTGQQPFKCKICGKRFTQSYVYKMHLKKHENDQNDVNDQDNDDVNDPDKKDVNDQDTDDVKDQDTNDVKDQDTNDVKDQDTDDVKDQDTNDVKDQDTDEVNETKTQSDLVVYN